MFSLSLRMTIKDIVEKEFLEISMPLKSNSQL